MVKKKGHVSESSRRQDEEDLCETLWMLIMNIDFFFFFMSLMLSKNILGQSHFLLGFLKVWQFYF